MTRSMGIIAFVFWFGCFPVAAPALQNVMVDFDSASDTGDFVTIRDDTPSLATLGIGQNPAKGVGTPAGGGLEVVNIGTTNGGNDLAALYAPGGTSSTNGHIRLNAGDSVTLNLKFFTSDATRAATPRLGIASASDVNLATTDGTLLDINGGKDIIGGTTANNWADGIAVNVNGGNNAPKAFSVVDVVGGGGRTLLSDPDGPYTLVDATWYEFVIEITKSGTIGRFDIAAVLNQLNADGTALSTQIGSVDTTITNAALYADDVIAGFTMVHNGVPATLSNEYDDFSVRVSENLDPPVFESQPVSPVSTVLGDEVTLGVSVSGRSPLFYQWHLDGLDIPGATNASLVVTNAGEVAAGPYGVTVTNGLGSATSSNLFLTYLGADLTPGQQVVLALNPIEIMPVLPDGPGRSYQWRLGGVELAGQTNLTLRTPPASVADSGSYDLVYSLGGTTVTSPPATVIVPPEPTEAYSALVTGDAPRAYWRLGEAAGSGLALEEVTGLDGAYGTNTAAGELGALLGDLNTAVRFLGDSNSWIEVAGGSGTLDRLAVPAPFSVEIWALAEGGQGSTRAAVSYVDYFNSTIIAGWSLYANDQDRWEFRTGEGTVNTPDTSAWNIIEGPPVVLGEWTHLVGTHDGTDMKFFVNGVEVGMISNAVYTPVDGFAAQAPCAIGAGSAQDGSFDVADYWVGKLDEPAFYGQALTETQILEHYAGAFPLDTLPRIDTQPANTAILEGLDTVLFAAANSVTLESYQWVYNGEALAGQTNNSLALTGVLASDAGEYHVVVSNNGGSVTSEVAALTVYPDAVGTVLSVNFLGYVNGVTWEGESIAANGGVAGFIRTNAWNEVGADQANNAVPLGGLTDDRGVLTGISLTWSAQNNRRGRLDELGGLVDADQAMYQGGLESGDDAADNAPAAIVTISNIPPQYTSLGYDVIVYLGGPAGGLTNRYDTVNPSFYGKITDGVTAYYFHTRDQRTWDGVFVEGTVTDPNTPAPPDANMVIFTGLTAPAVTLTADLHPVIGAGPAQISGFQIVPGRTTPAIPITIGTVGGVITVDWTGDGVLQHTTGLPADAWSDIDDGAVTHGPYTVPSPQAVESFRLRVP